MSYYLLQLHESRLLKKNRLSPAFHLRVHETNCSSMWLTQCIGIAWWRQVCPFLCVSIYLSEKPLKCQMPHIIWYTRDWWFYSLDGCSVGNNKITAILVYNCCLNCRVKQISYTFSSVYLKKIAQQIIYNWCT